MSSTTPTLKESTHKRIVDTAAKAIRRSGCNGTSIADIMKVAGLTHGGFYAHFASRDAMLAEAVDCAGNESVAALKQAAAQAAPRDALQAIAGAYLSRNHVENVEEGCLIAALASEIPRQVPEVRCAATRVVEQMIDLVARHANGAGGPGTHEQALATVATMVGALVLARTVEDPALADALLKAALTRLPHADSC